MKVGDVLDRDHRGVNVEVIRPDSTLRQAARKLIDHGVGAVVVVDAAGRSVGLISEHDLIQALANHPVNVADTPVSAIMTRNVISCDADTDAVDAMLLMKSHGIRNMPVTEAGDLVGMIGIRDLTQVCEHLQIEANIDVLTGISNRRHFLRILETEFDRSRRFGHDLSVAMLDIDNFKRINDTYGHEAGDKVLSALSGLIARELRTIDTVGRLGGEEFAIVFSETGVESAERACGRILDKIRAFEVDIGETRICFTVTFGLVGADPETEGADNVLHRADKLLYQGKTSGKNRIVAEGRVPEQPRMAG